MADLETLISSAPVVPGLFVEAIASYFKQTIGIHACMLEKLSEPEAGLPLEVAEIFEDIANTYLNIAELIENFHLQKQISDVEQNTDSIVELIWGRQKPEV
jgi:hypothetical protein